MLKAHVAHHKIARALWVLERYIFGPQNLFPERHGRLLMHLLEITPHHHLHDSVMVEVFDRGGSDELAVAHHDGIVRDARQFFQFVRDVGDGDAFALSIRQ